jgi:hypothetical protein
MHLCRPAQEGVRLDQKRHYSDWIPLEGMKEKEKNGLHFQKLGRFGGPCCYR